MMFGAMVMALAEDATVSPKFGTASDFTYRASVYWAIVTLTTGMVHWCESVAELLCSWLW